MSVLSYADCPAGGFMDALSPHTRARAGFIDATLPEPPVVPAEPLQALRGLLAAVDAGDVRLEGLVLDAQPASGGVTAFRVSGVARWVGRRAP